MSKFFRSRDIGLVRVEDDGSATAFHGGRPYAITLSEIFRDQTESEQLDISEEAFNMLLEEYRVARREFLASCNRRSNTRPW